LLFPKDLVEFKAEYFIVDGEAKRSFYPGFINVASEILKLASMRKQIVNYIEKSNLFQRGRAYMCVFESFKEHLDGFLLFTSKLEYRFLYKLN
jgi:hypothetical protein